MGALLARCRIGCQIAALGFVGVLGVLCVVAVNLWSDTRIMHVEAMVTAARDASDTQRDLQRQLLEARRFEKNFILRRDEPSVTDHAKTMTIVRDLFADLQTRTAGQPELRARIERIAANIARYGTAFDGLVRTARVVGLNWEDGLRGQLLKDIRGVEATPRAMDAPHAVIAILMMRRHEKDFLSRLDPRYGVEMKARVPELVAALDAAAVPAATRASLLAGVTRYQDVFARLVDGTLAEQAAEKAMMTAYRDAEPPLAALNRASFSPILQLLETPRLST